MPPAGGPATNLHLAPYDTPLGRLIRLPLRLIPRRCVLTIRRGIAKGMKWRVGAGIHSYWLGIYEPAKQPVAASLVRPGMTALDIGAHAGFYTLAFSRLVGERGSVYALEPFAHNVENLLFHVRINGCRNVTILQAAASESTGYAGFRIDALNSCGSLSEAESTYRVPTLSLDDAVARGVLPHPDVVKMDIEGAEVAVLRGAKRMLAERRAAWLIALHSPGLAREAEAILRDAGYDIEVLEPDLEIVARPRPAAPGEGAPR